jgi:hypothetical protein
VRVLNGKKMRKCKTKVGNDNTKEVIVFIEGRPIVAVRSSCRGRGYSKLSAGALFVAVRSSCRGRGYSKISAGALFVAIGVRPNGPLGHAKELRTSANSPGLRNSEKLGGL